MRGTTERPSTPGTAAAVPDVADGASADDHAARGDTAALRAALSTLESALAERHTAGPTANAAEQQPLPRPAPAPRQQAIRRHPIAQTVVGIARSPAADRALRAYEGYESLIDRAATAAARRARSTARAVPIVIIRPIRAVRAASTRPSTDHRAVSAPVTTSKAAPPKKAAQNWPFAQPEIVTVAYPKRRPGGGGDGSFIERLAGAIPLLLSVGVIAIALGCYSNSIGRFFNRAAVLSAPTLTNRPLAEAQDAAHSMGLEVEVARVEPSDRVPKDTVLDQTPRPGLRVQPGGVLKLTVSGGLLPPNVIGKTVDQARVQLIIEGWKPDSDVEIRVANNAAPNVVIDQRPRPDEATPAKGPVTLVVAAPNLAHGKSVRTSSGGVAPEVLDGQPATHSPAWTGAPSWLEIDFNGGVSIASVSLLPALERPGGAVVELWAWDTTGRFYPLHLIAQGLHDGTPITARLAPTAANVVRLRVATTASEGPLAWREITVLGP